MPISPAAKQRPKQVDRNLAEARAGQSYNRDRSDKQAPESHGRRSKDVPNTYPGDRR
jgi:hypothetical protein